MKQNMQNQASTKFNLVNGIQIDALKDTVGQISKDPELGKCHFKASNKWAKGNHNCTMITDFYGAKQNIQHKQKFEIHADEPQVLAGEDKAANPVEILLASLISCITTSLVAHAAVRGIEIQEVESTLEGDINLNGYLGLDANIPKGYQEIRVNMKIKSNEKDLKKLKSLAEFSPVYNTLMNGTKINLNLENKN